MKTALFICNSYLQLFNAINLTMQSLKDTKVDVIITDHSVGSFAVTDRLRQVSVFDMVFEVSDCDYSNYVGYTSAHSKACVKLMESMGSYFGKKRLIHGAAALWNGDGSYDSLYIANYNRFSKGVFFRLLQRNSKLKLYMFDEGWFTYTINMLQQGKFDSMINRFFPCYAIAHQHLAQLWLYEPELLQASYGVSVCRIPPITPQHHAVRKIINFVFDYENMVDTYDEPFLFFEESFFQDGITNGDLDVVLQISKQVGKDNLLVKRHPRNRVNRFEAAGIKTNQVAGIPFEVICMNMPDMVNKTFLSISSTAALTPKLILNAHPKTILLYKAIDFPIRTLSSQFTEYIRRFKTLDESMQLYTPNSLEDLQTLIQSKSKA